MGTDLLVETFSQLSSFPQPQKTAICSHRFVNIAEQEEFKFSCFNVRLWLYYSGGLGWDLAHQPGVIDKRLIKTYRRDRVGGFLECYLGPSSLCMEMSLPGRNRSLLTKTLEWRFLFQQSNERWWWYSKLFSLHPRKTKKKKGLIGCICFFFPYLCGFLLLGNTLVTNLRPSREICALCVLAKPLSGVECWALR